MPSRPPPVKLHLGCGPTRLDGWLNCDLSPGPAVDCAFDLDQPWPFPDHAVEEIYASHVLEHLKHPYRFFSEAWRVLGPNRQMLVRVPYGAHRAAWWDLEHQRPWFGESFCFLQPGYAEAVGNPQHDGWRAYFSVELVDMRLSARWARRLRWRWLRPWLVRWANECQDFCEELWVYLVALKTPESVAQFLRSRPANLIPCRYVVYRHHAEGRNLARSEPTTLIPVAELQAANAFQ